jgi:Lon protease-like protein
MDASGIGADRLDVDPQISGFANQCRLFPLPNLVFFPHSILPLHIFEARYRQMTGDALAGDQLVTMVQTQPAPASAPWPEPVPIMDVGCLGTIVQHERLPDGRFNILLLGRKRVRLKTELSSAKLYRIAEAEILDDHETGRPLDEERSDLLSLFRVVLEKHRCLEENLAALLDSDMPLGVLTDIIAHALPLGPIKKQELLAEVRVELRLEALRVILRQIAEHDEPAAEFPPRFSVN